MLKIINRKKFYNESFNSIKQYSYIHTEIKYENNDKRHISELITFLIQKGYFLHNFGKKTIYIKSFRRGNIGNIDIDIFIHQNNKIINIDCWFFKIN